MNSIQFYPIKYFSYLCVTIEQFYSLITYIVRSCCCISKVIGVVIDTLYIFIYILDPKQNPLLDPYICGSKRSICPTPGCAHARPVIEVSLNILAYPNEAINLWNKTFSPNPSIAIKYSSIYSVNLLNNGTCEMYHHLGMVFIYDS